MIQGCLVAERVAFALKKPESASYLKLYFNEEATCDLTDSVDTFFQFLSIVLSFQDIDDLASRRQLMLHANS
eukprot:8815140-Karenia_brevis.AAC.1